MSFKSVVKMVTNDCESMFYISYLIGLNNLGVQAINLTTKLEI